MKKILNRLYMSLFLVVLSVGSFAFASAPVAVSPQVLMSSKIPFVAHTGPGPFDNALAMNVPYQPIASLRHQLSTLLNYNLNAFRGWNPSGEAHITVITPPEYAIVGRYVSIKKMNEIAVRNKIQYSDLQILGLGSGYSTIDMKTQSTYFLIVRSKNLISIRQQIYFEYLKNGGHEADWNPMHFYPHITIGFTLRDLHEQDGVIKDLEHSPDRRFKLFWINK